MNSRQEQQIRSNTSRFIELYLTPDIARSSAQWENPEKAFGHLKKWWNSRINRAAIAGHCRRMNYYEFLSTPYWSAISFEVKRLSDYKCSNCSSFELLNAHHDTYEVRGLELDNLWALRCLCRRCHRFAHYIRGGGIAFETALPDTEPLAIEFTTRELKTP